MDRSTRNLFACLALGVGLAGCGPARDADGPVLDEPVSLGVTVGSLGRLYQVDAVPVRGYGIVAGLAGTGSAECPPDLRQTLIKYIQQQMPREVSFDPESFINSRDTAVVEVYGVIPSLAAAGENFDVKVRAMSRSQTTSLEGGRLYTTELTEARGFAGTGAYLKALARAKGPVYIDRVSSSPAPPLDGYVLGGGTVLSSVQVLFVLDKPNYFTAKTIRDRLNERFGRATANALSASEIRINVPPRYRDLRQKFLALLRQVYLPDATAPESQRIAALVEALVTGPERMGPELALEAIGRRAAEALAGLLAAEDPAVRFGAARCLMNVGDDRGLKVLEAFATDPALGRRLEAIEAIGRGADRSVAAPILRRLVAEEDFEVRLAAYRQLRRLEDLSIRRVLVGGDFFVETLEGGGPKVVYVSRRGSPRVVVFGAPAPCAPNVFFESSDKRVIINARPDDAYVSLVRKDPRFPRPVGPLRSKRTASDVVRTLCERLEVTGAPTVRPGLNIPYCDAVAMVQAMCEAGMIEAEFKASPLTEVGPPKTEDASPQEGSGADTDGAQPVGQGGDA